MGKKQVKMTVKRVVWGVLLCIVSVFFADIAVHADSGKYIPTTNLITVEGIPITLPGEVFFSSNDDRDYGEIAVTWDALPNGLFSSAGKYEVTGRTAENQPVKGIIHVYSKSSKVKISAIGDSLTEGAGLNRAQAYPAQLNNRLGERYEVSNFGHSGATLSSGDVMSYKNKKEYTDSRATAFDVAVIQLGSNDSWDKYWWNQGMHARFKDEYVSFIKEYKALNQDAVLYVCLPSYMGTGLKNNFQYMLPDVIRAAREADLDVSIIDNYTISEGLPDTGYYLNDRLHPTAKGISVSTNNIYKRIHGEEQKILAGVVSAQSFDESNKIVNEKEAGSGQFYLDGISNGDWVSFKNVDFDQNLGEIHFNTQSYDPNISGNVQVEVRLDALDGKIIGKGAIRKENSWTDSKLYNEAASGVHDVFIKVIHPNKNSFDYLFKLKTIDFSTQTSAQNSLRNGDFEEGMNYWSGDNTTDYGVDGNQPYAGRGKLWLYNNNKLERTVTQKVTGLADGIYTINAMAKRTTPAGTARMVLTTAGKSVVEPIAVSNEYKKISRVVEVKNGELSISFGYKSSSGESGLVIDNVELVQGGTKPAENYLEDGDFEADETKWKATGSGNSGVDTYEAYSGQKLWLYSDNAFDRTVYQELSGLDDGIYTIKAMVKRTTPAGTARLETTTSGEETIVKPIGVSQEYKELTQMVEVKNGQLKIAFRYKLSEKAAGGLVVDNVQLLKGGTLPPKNYVKDGGFEADDSPWRGMGTGNYGVDTYEAYSGQKLWIYQSGTFDRTVYQDVKDLDNGIYTVKAMVKRTTAVGTTQMEVTADETVIKSIPVNQDYEKITQVIEVKNHQVRIAFRYQSSDRGAGGLVVDDVELTKGGVLPAKNYLKNSSFELDLQDWKTEGTPNSFGVDTYDALSGKKLWFYSNSTYESRVYQDITGLENGYYTVTAMVKLSQAMTKSMMEVETSQKNSITIPATNKYEKINYTVKVTDGKLRVGFYGKDTGRRGFQVDDVRVEKEP
ncbi:GDSL-type esterase/lipase family protein [Enterococcus sp. AZ192]|uniref:GDSL-type esterase/lipase family protein n=1 Tax=unclassified Enterococcus TaxID=2608891 RepID=UPI003D2658E3